MWSGLWSISRACLCGPEKPMIMSSSTGSGEEHTCKGGSWSPCFIKGRFQPFLLGKNSFENGKQHKLIIMVESAIIKKSLIIHWLLTAGRWDLNKHSQNHVNFGEEAPYFPSCRGGCASRATLGPPEYLSAGHLREKQPLAPTSSRTLAWGQCPIEGFRMPWIPTSLLCPAPLLRLLLPFLPSPNLSLFSDRVFPNPKAFCSSRSPCPAIMPGWACWPSRSRAPWRLRGDAELYSECDIK